MDWSYSLSLRELTPPRICEHFSPLTPILFTFQLVSSDVYASYQRRSMQQAESQAADSFHCRTKDCHGWCFYERHLNTFQCIVCQKRNCLRCKAIHFPDNCRQYQQNATMGTSKEAIQTTKYFEVIIETDYLFSIWVYPKEVVRLLLN